MKRLLFTSIAAVAAAACISAAQSTAPKFDGSRAYEDMRQVVALGPRPAGSAAAQQTRAYITKQLAAAGITTEEQAFTATTPLGPVKMVNLRATIPGPGRGRLVIGGHYDTKIFHEFPFVGANDAGSSTAFLIELGRVLKARKNGITIELLFLDGEESTGDWDAPPGNDHTYGSQYYVDSAKKAGTLKDIRAFILVDMIGDRMLKIKREQHSTRWLTDAIWGAAKTLKRPEFSEVVTPIEDDHLPFLEAGVEAVDIIDLEYYTRSGSVAWHTRDDTMENVAAGSLEAVGQVLLAALPEIEQRLAK